MKKMPVIIMCGILSLSVVHGVSKFVQTIMDVDEHVNMVKNAENSNYLGITYGEAFEAFFANPSWRYFQGVDSQDDETEHSVDESAETQESTEYLDVVEFTGKCMYQDVEVEALIQFKIDEEQGMFSAIYLSFNEVPQNMLMLSELIDAAFSSYATDESKGTGDTKEESQIVVSEDGEYKNLEDFINCINSFSDPPTYTGKELDNYYKKQYDEWKSGKAFGNIVQNLDGSFSYINYAGAYGTILDRLTNEYGEYTRYTLYDLDNDGIKELIVSYGTCEADWYNDVYTYDSGAASYLGGFYSSVMLYIAEDGNGIYAVSGKMGYQTIEQISIENDQLQDTVIVSGEDIGINGDYYSNDNPIEMVYTSDYSMLY